LDGLATDDGAIDFNLPARFELEYAEKTARNISR